MEGGRTRELEIRMMNCQGLIEIFCFDLLGHYQFGVTCAEISSNFRLLEYIEDSLRIDDKFMDILKSNMGDRLIESFVLAIDAKNRCLFGFIYNI